MSTPTYRSTCRSCNARILWAATDNGKSMPIDTEPASDGNVELVRTPHDPIIRAKVRPADWCWTPMQNRYRSHFSTCPNAAHHRRATP